MCLFSQVEELAGGRYVGHQLEGRGGCVIVQKLCRGITIKRQQRRK